MEGKWDALWAAGCRPWREAQEARTLWGLSANSDGGGICSLWCLPGRVVVRQ